MDQKNAVPFSALSSQSGVPKYMIIDYLLGTFLAGGLAKNTSGVRGRAGPARDCEGAGENQHLAQGERAPMRGEYALHQTKTL